MVRLSEAPAPIALIAPSPPNALEGLPETMVPAAPLELPAPLEISGLLELLGLLEPLEPLDGLAELLELPALLELLELPVLLELLDSVFSSALPCTIMFTVMLTAGVSILSPFRL